MTNRLLTLRGQIPNAPNKTLATVKQKFTHGRTRTVVVEKSVLKGSAPEKERSNGQIPVPPPVAIQPGKRKKTNKNARSLEKRKEQQKAAKIERTRKAIERLRELGLRVRDAAPRESRKAREARASARQENLKDKVAQIVATILQATVANLPNLADAREELAWLGTLKVDRWGDGDRRRVTFAKGVLQAIINGNLPTTIEKPDGGFFRWPSTNVENGRGVGHMETPSEEIGVLRSVGYQVGEKGRSLSERRALLVKIYEQDLNLRLSARYLSEWGRPKTAQRLQKLANTIASLTRNIKRRAAQSSAIDAWESDLEFLKHTYYIARYSFPWPRYS